MRAVLGMLILAAAGVAQANWRYEVDTDQMTGKKESLAYIVSDNSLNLGFPYRGENHGRLAVRRHPKFGLDVYFTIEKGQIICRSFDESCALTIRFDDKPPMRFAAVGPADHSTTIVFLKGPSRFIAEAKKAKRILVQPTLYQAGSPVLVFTTVQPLDWPIGSAGSGKKK